MIFCLGRFSLNCSVANKAEAAVCFFFIDSNLIVQMLQIVFPLLFFGKNEKAVLCQHA